MERDTTTRQEQLNGLHAVPLDQVERGPLTNFLPEGYTTIEEVDDRCLRLAEGGALHVVRNEQIDGYMDRIKNPGIDMRDFRWLADAIMRRLTEEARYRTVSSRHEVKPTISWRAGNAFQGPILTMFPDAEIGFAQQKRDEETLQPTTDLAKLGDYEGKHAIIFDPMLATGGSMLDLVEAVHQKGASGITTVSAFTAPQGLIAVANHGWVDQMITTPLEAGLNAQGFIVGGHQPNSMLGDFGDRYFGSVD